MNLTKLIGSFNFKKFSKASRTDFGVLKVACVEAEEEKWRYLSPAFQHAYSPGSCRRIVDLVPQNFVTRVERLVAQYGDETGAASELKELVEGSVK